MKKYLLIPAVMVTFLTFSVKPADAFWPFDGWSTSTTTQGQFSPMIEKLITTFKLDRSKVAEAVSGFRDEQRTERQTQMEAKLTARLTQAVTDGKLTEVQKTLILQKHEEMQKLNDQDFENRQTRRAELQKWASDNGIDMQYLGFGGMGRGGKGEMMEGRRGMMNW